MFAQYPGLKSSCRSLWAGLPFPLAVTFGRRRAVHSFGSDRFVQPGRCTFAHSGSWRAEDFSKSASFEYPPFRDSHLPTRRVVLLSALYSLLPILSIGLIEFLPKKVLRVILLRKMQKDCILVLHFTQNPCILFPAPKLQSSCNLGN